MTPAGGFSGTVVSSRDGGVMMMKGKWGGGQDVSAQVGDGRECC